MFWIYCIVFLIVATFLLRFTDRPEDPWPGITAAGCFAIGFLWPVLLPIFLVAFLLHCVRDAIESL